MNLKDYPPIKYVIDILKNVKKGEDILDMEIYTKEEIDEKFNNSEWNSGNTIFDFTDNWNTDEDSDNTEGIFEFIDSWRKEA